MKSLDLFSCIGCHAIGFRRAGIETVLFCEKDEWRRAWLSDQFPGVQLYDDIRQFHWVFAEARSVEIVIGGPPCQATSVAAAIHNKRTGKSLWPEMLRVGIEASAEWFVVEQPPGNAAWEATVADDLSHAGYHVARFEFGAHDVGAPYIRRRVFMVANACLARLSLAWQAIPQEIDRIARAAAAGNPWHEGPPRTLRVAHGPSGWLDRNAAVEAIGDANPPAMATVIGRAIMKSRA